MHREYNTIQLIVQKQYFDQLWLFCKNKKNIFITWLIMY